MPPRLVSEGCRPDRERDHLLQLMRGPSVEIRMGPKMSFLNGNDRETAAWSLPKSLLAYHSGLFKAHFTGENPWTDVTIDDEPYTFELFVEFMLRGQYTFRDDVNPMPLVRHSARAWALGSYLEAPHFQNLAMEHLYNMYKPGPDSKPLYSIGPDAIKFVLEKSAPCEELYEFFKDVTVNYWRDDSVIIRTKDNEDMSETWECNAPKAQWDWLFNNYPNFHDELLEGLGRDLGPRDGIKDFQDYLVPIIVEMEDATAY